MNHLKQLMVFHQVVRSGNVSAAARQLQLTQSAVSHALKHLEGELGTALLTRDRNQCVLTPAGVRWVRAAEQIAATLEQTQQEHQLDSSHQRIEITLATHVTLGMRWVLPQLHMLEKKFPTLMLHYRFADPMNALVDWVLGGQADVSIVARPSDAHRVPNCVV